MRIKAKIDKSQYFYIKSHNFEILSHNYDIQIYNITIYFKTLCNLLKYYSLILLENQDFLQKVKTRSHNFFIIGYSCYYFFHNIVRLTDYHLKNGEMIEKLK